MRTLRFFPIISIALMNLLNCPNASAGTGIETITINGQDDRSFCSLIQPDGKIILGGLSVDPSTRRGIFALARIDGQGAMDATFQSSGKVTTDFGTQSSQVHGLLLQTDGLSIAAGTSYTQTDSKFALARYTSNGALDTTFGTSGKVSLSLGSRSFAEARFAAIQSDGKILVVGRMRTASQSKVAVARFTTTGSLDSSFGTGGKTVFSMLNASDGVSVALSGSSILVGAQVWNGSHYVMGVARLHSNGTLDSSFGPSGNGLSMFDFGTAGGDVFLATLAVDSLNRILAGGYVTQPNGNFAIARLEASGQLDNTFGISGRITADLGADDHLTALAVQADGGILAAGTSQVDDLHSQVGLARFLDNGSLDTTLNPGGGEPGTQLISSGDIAFGQSVLVQSDGRIVIGGYGVNPSNKKFLAIRTLSDGTLDASF